jgi:SAM-dependent methyltransferase
VQVNFEVADATALRGFQDRFDTVVDSSFYHVFLDDEETQGRYARALHRATRPGARLFMFEFGQHNVNGLPWFGLPAENFERVLPAAGWRLDYLGPTTYLANFSTETFKRMSEILADNQDLAARIELMLERFAVIEPLLDHHRVHLPYWAVHATRLD